MLVVQRELARGGLAVSPDKPGPRIDESPFQYMIENCQGVALHLRGVELEVRHLSRAVRPGPFRFGLRTSVFGLRTPEKRTQGINLPRPADRIGRPAGPFQVPKIVPAHHRALRIHKTGDRDQMAVRVALQCLGQRETE
jgi:hypothetical protein